MPLNRATCHRAGAPSLIVLLYWTLISAKIKRARQAKTAFENTGEVAEQRVPAHAQGFALGTTPRCPCPGVSAPAPKSWRTAGGAEKQAQKAASQPVRACTSGPENASKRPLLRSLLYPLASPVDRISCGFACTSDRLSRFRPCPVKRSAGFRHWASLFTCREHQSR